jgi:putative hydrolase of the HAD superfamily
MIPEALVFDFDGLILDTEVPIYEAWRQNFLAFEQELTLEDYAACVGSNFAAYDPKRHLESLTDQPIDWAHWDLSRERDALKRTHQLEVFPGILPLLDDADAKGIPCAVASSSPRSWVEGHLDRLGILHRFALTRCIDDVAAAKPAPDLFLAATGALGIAVERAIVLEDSLNGLRASLAAGFPCVIVPNRITSHLTFEGAAAILETLAGVDLSQLAQLAARATRIR